MRRARELAEKGDVIARLDALIGTSWFHSVKGDLERLPFRSPWSARTWPRKPAPALVW